MQQEQSSEHASNHDKREDPQTEIKLIWSVSGTATAIHVFLIGVFLLWVFLPDYVPDRSDRAKVFIESMLSLGIVIVVVVHAIMYYKQAKALDAQLKISEATRKVMVDDSKNTLRAYVNIRAGNVFLAVSQPSQVAIEIVNFGKTPANRVRTFINAEIRSVSDPPEKATVASIADDEGNGIPMAPSMAVGRVAQTVQVLTQEQSDQIRLGNARLFVWGIVAYKDIFRRHRYTTFCFLHAYPHPTLTPWQDGNEAT